MSNLSAYRGVLNRSQIPVRMGLTILFLFLFFPTVLLGQQPQAENSLVPQVDMADRREITLSSSPSNQTQNSANWQITSFYPEPILFGAIVVILLTLLGRSVTADFRRAKSRQKARSLSNASQ